MVEETVKVLHLLDSIYGKNAYYTQSVAGYSIVTQWMNEMQIDYELWVVGPNGPYPYGYTFTVHSQLDWFNLRWL
jgi:hypothetical protein